MSYVKNPNVRLITYVTDARPFGHTFFLRQDAFALKFFCVAMAIHLVYKWRVSRTAATIDAHFSRMIPIRSPRPQRGSNDYNDHISIIKKRWTLDILIWSKIPCGVCYLLEDMIFLTVRTCDFVPYWGRWNRKRIYLAQYCFYGKLECVIFQVSLISRDTTAPQSSWWLQREWDWKPIDMILRIFIDSPLVLDWEMRTWMIGVWRWLKCGGEPVLGRLSVSNWMFWLRMRQSDSD